MGSPCDLYLRLEKLDGTLIAEADATGADEGSLTNKFGDAGTARLVVEELNHGGGSEFSYEIEIVALEPGFTLTVATNTVVGAPGGHVLQSRAWAEHRAGQPRPMADVPRARTLRLGLLPRGAGRSARIRITGASSARSGVGMKTVPAGPCWII
jgi:hypothetical protein